MNAMEYTEMFEFIIISGLIGVGLFSLCFMDISNPFKRKKSLNQMESK